MKLLEFLGSKIFLKQLGLALAVAVGLIWLTFLVLKKYTHHGEKLPVPDLYGMSLEEVEAIIENNDLRYTVIDSAFHSNMRPGCVLGQHPEADFKVKRSRTIFLTINSRNPEKVRFPELTNYSFRQAIAILESTGFEIGKLEYIPSDFRNLVLAQKYQGDTIMPGSMIVKGAIIDLVLGKGKNNTNVLIPNLIGQNRRKARRTIIFSNLNVGKAYYDNSIVGYQDSAQALVWQQYPAFDEKLRIQPGDQIHIWLTRDSTKLANIILHQD